MKDWELEIIQRIKIIVNGGHCLLECEYCPFTISPFQCPQPDLLIKKATDYLVKYYPKEKKDDRKEILEIS